MSLLQDAFARLSTHASLQWVPLHSITCSGTGYLPLFFHSAFLHFASPSQFASFLLPLLPTASLSTLLLAIQTISCSLSKFTTHTRCYLCLTAHSNTYYNFIHASAVQDSHSTIDFNELYFSLFDLVHSSILPRLSSSFAPLCHCEASIVYHSSSFISFSTDHSTATLTLSLSNTQTAATTREIVSNSWVFLHAGKLRDFIQNTLLNNASLLSHSSSSILLYLYSVVPVDLLIASVADEMNSNVLQFSVFLSSIQLVNAMETSFKQCKSETEYYQRVLSYQSALNSVMTILGGLSVILLQYPALKPFMSLLVIQLFKWVINNDNNIIYDLALHQLIKFARYSVIVCKKQLFSVLPDCIVGEIAKSLFTISPQRQDSIIRAVFDSSISRSDFYIQLSTYILPVYINQLDVASIISLAHSLFPSKPISASIAVLFQGDRCIYNVLVYLLKHMTNDNIKPWELFFFLQSSFTDEEIEKQPISFPQSSNRSLMKMVQEQGHCVLWPLLFDCTSGNVHDREISETALKSLCEWPSLLLLTRRLYESNGSQTRSDLFLKSFHYFNFQINQALSFNQYDLQRAILALKRSLDDYKNTCALKDISMPDNFLWGVLSFVKNVLQVPSLLPLLHRSDPKFNSTPSFSSIPSSIRSPSLCSFASSPKFSCVSPPPSNGSIPSSRSSRRRTLSSCCSLPSSGDCSVPRRKSPRRPNNPISYSSSRKPKMTLLTPSVSLKKVAFSSRFMEMRKALRILPLPKIPCLASPKQLCLQFKTIQKGMKLLCPTFLPPSSNGLPPNFLRESWSA